MKTSNLVLALVTAVTLSAMAETGPAPAATVAATPTGIAAPAASTTPAAAAATSSSSVAAGPAPRVVFQINVAEDAPTILRFVTNYLIAEPTAKVAVVGYGPGIDFMLKDAKDPKGVAYEPQLAALKARGVEFKVCNNTLKARNVTADVVSREAVVVPGAVNEILRLQTREGYAYFQH
jgi:intracellular sulfur oxidation DsrE/DsrF family protein